MNDIQQMVAIVVGLFTAAVLVFSLDVFLDWKYGGRDVHCLWKPWQLFWEDIKRKLGGAK